MSANWPVGPISYGTAEMAPPAGFAWRHIEEQIGDKMFNHLLYSDFLLMLVMGGLDKTILCSVAKSFGSSEEACDICIHL